MKEMLVTDSFGNDITNNFVSEAKPLLHAKKYLEMRNIIEARNYQISYTETDSQVSTRAAYIQGSNIQKFYEIRTSDKGYRKEWLTVLKVRYTYQQNTYQINWANATISFEGAAFGAYFSPYITNINTYAKISQNKYSVTFGRNYTMMADFSPAIWLPGVPNNFGQISRSYTIQP